MAFDTTPQTTGPDPYFAHMEAQNLADKASFEARMAAKYPAVSVKSGIEVTGSNVATHEHANNRVVEVTR